MARIAARGFSAVVLDSLPALPSTWELSDNPPEWAELNRRMSTTIAHAMPQLAGETARSGCTLFLINQMRERAGAMWGDPLKPTGGRAIGYYAALRLRLYVTAPIRAKGPDVIGVHIRADVTKAKYTGARKTALISLLYGRGFTDTKI